MKIEFNLQNLINSYEKKNKTVLSLEKLEKETDINIEKIQKMYKSHILDTKDITVFEAVKIAGYFGVSLDEFISYEAPINTKFQKNVTIISVRGDKETNPVKDARCHNAESFYKAMSGSKYLDTYMGVHGLMDEVGSLLNKDARFLAGVVENFNIKLINEAVLVRFTVSGNKIKINKELFGKSQELNRDHDYYIKIYNRYTAYKGNEFVESYEDVTNLLNILEAVMNQTKTVKL